MGAAPASSLSSSVARARAIREEVVRACVDVDVDGWGHMLDRLHTIIIHRSSSSSCAHGYIYTPLNPPTQPLSPHSPLLVLDDDDAFTASSSRALSLHAREPSILLEVGAIVCVCVCVCVCVRLSLSIFMRVSVRHDKTEKTPTIST